MLERTDRKAILSSEGHTLVKTCRKSQSDSCKCRGKECAGKENSKFKGLEAGMSGILCPMFSVLCSVL